ncbi:hypothetical protein HDU82_003015, partial [Entophlyctis luteolus]
DGSIRPQTLIDLAAEQGIPLPAKSVKDLNRILFKESYSSLEEYLECFKYTTQVLRNVEALERVSYELAVDQFAVGVRYLEVRFSPQLLAIPGKLTIEMVIDCVNRGLARAQLDINSTEKIIAGEPEFKYALIMCAMRYFTPESSPWFSDFWEFHKHEQPSRIYSLASMALVATCHEVRMTTGIPIVAIDIAGAEYGYPAEDHKEAFSFAHKRFFFKTVHAGEGYGPESIFQAITDCHAERVGHGLRLFDTSTFSTNGTTESRNEYINQLTEYMSSMRICIEVCLTSNMQTLPDITLGTHPARKMIERKMAVTLCSDNTTVSHTDVLRELKLAIGAFELNPRQVRDITLTGFKRSFMPGDYTEKRAYNRKVIDFYRRLETDFGVMSE